MAEAVELLRVFISSKQVEFRDVRAGIADVLRGLPLLAADFAEDWPPERAAVQPNFLDRVRRAPIFMALFGCEYSAPTVLEYQTAIENPRREILVYEKSCPSRDPRLVEFLQARDDPAEGHTIGHFTDWEDLRPRFEKHLWAAVRRMAESYLWLSEPRPTSRAELSVMEQRWLQARDELLGLGLPGAASPADAMKWATRLEAMIAAAEC